MVNLTNYPFPTYEPNRHVAGVLASLVALSLIGWIIQSIQSRFVPRRICILLLISHSTIFVKLVLRAVFSSIIQKSRVQYTAGTILLAVGQRLLIVSNYDFLIEVRDIQLSVARIIRIGTIVGVILSGVLMFPAGTLSYKTKTIKTSFILQQISASMVLFIVEFFYLFWFLTRTSKEMGTKAIILLTISSFSSLIVAVFNFFMSVPDYYVGTSQHELWLYLFQLVPIIVSQGTWTILHPKRSLLPNHELKEPVEV
jgi:hypothetical protein